MDVRETQYLPKVLRQKTLTVKQGRVHSPVVVLKF